MYHSLCMNTSLILFENYDNNSIFGCTVPMSKSTADTKTNEWRQSYPEAVDLKSKSPKTFHYCRVIHENTFQINGVFLCSFSQQRFPILACQDLAVVLKYTTTQTSVHKSWEFMNSRIQRTANAHTKNRTWKKILLDFGGSVSAKLCDDSNQKSFDHKCNCRAQYSTAKNVCTM